MPELILKTAFDDLPEEIRVWLRSEAAASLVDQLNARYKLEGDQLDAVPCIASWIPLLYLEPELTIPSLVDDFAIDPKVAPLLAKDIEHLLFAPIKLAMRQKLGVDIEKMATPPTAPAVAPKQPTPVVRPRVTDIVTPPKQAVISAPSAVAPAKTQTPKRPTPSAPDTLRTEKPIGLSEVAPPPPTPHEVEKYEDHHPMVE